MEVFVHEDLLWRIVLEPDQSLVDPRLQIDADARRVPFDLFDLLIEGEHHGPFTEPCTLRDVLQGHDALAYA